MLAALTPNAEKNAAFCWASRSNSASDAEAPSGFSISNTNLAGSFECSTPHRMIALQKRLIGSVRRLMRPWSAASPSIASQCSSARE